MKAEKLIEFQKEICDQMDSMSSVKQKAFDLCKNLNQGIAFFNKRVVIMNDDGFRACADLTAKHEAAQRAYEAISAAIPNGSAILKMKPHERQAEEKVDGQAKLEVELGSYADVVVEDYDPLNTEAAGDELDLSDWVEIPKDPLLLD